MANTMVTPIRVGRSPIAPTNRPAVTAPRAAMVRLTERRAAFTRREAHRGCVLANSPSRSRSPRCCQALQAKSCEEKEMANKCVGREGNEKPGDGIQRAGEDDRSSWSDSRADRMCTGRSEEACDTERRQKQAVCVGAEPE